jgi:sugar lactone lactonase YvrE
MKKLLLFSSIVLCTSSFAVKTERWEINSAQAFLHGKLNRLIVSSDGDLRLGYGNNKLGEFAKEVWCSAVGRDGTIYFGTGSPADVYAVGKDGQAGKVFQTDAIAVTALAIDSHGNVYAATLAEGKIFKISAGKPSPRDAEGSGRQKDGAEFCRVRAPYVWSLVFDKDDRLYAGTGPDGKIYRISTDGKAEEWFAGEEANILSLAVDADGALLAGGSDRGLLYRISEKGKGVVLQEFGEDEVKSLLVSGRDLYVGVNKQRVRRPRAVGTRRPSAAEFEDLTERLTSQYGTRAAVETSERPRETPPEARLGNIIASTLYKRNADGRVDRLAMWDNEAIMNMALDADGNVLIAAAGQGRVYRVHGSDRWELLFDLDEQQALTVAVRDGHLVFVGTGNIGNGYRIDSQAANDGDYTSEIHDCKFLTTWGNLSWMGTGAVAVTTRTGNTALPDNTWSDWSAPLKVSPSKVASPRSRFIQIRAHLERASDPVLESISLYSQIQNQKPEVTALEIGEKPKPAAPEKPKTDSTEEPEKKPEEPKPKAATPVKKITWHADSRDGDTLVYRLYFKAEGDDVWVPVPLDKPLKKTEYAWDTESVADGWYRLKLVASDEESNPAGDALTDDKVSDPVKVDNTRPAVVNLAFNSSTLTGIARDNLSLIRNLEYAVDGGEWKFFAPKDGVFDDREEAFEVKLDPLKPGPHTIAVRATDEEGNIGVEKLSVRVK